MNAMRLSGRFPHVYWIDLQNDGMAVECVVIKRDRGGNIFFIQLNQLDEIDLNRLRNIITNRNANNFELWDLMTQVTLGNGVNALTYFHQLVRVLTPAGQITTPRSGQTGIDIRQQQPQSQQAVAPQQYDVDDKSEPKRTTRKKTD